MALDDFSEVIGAASLNQVPRGNLDDFSEIIQPGQVMQPMAPALDPALSVPSPASSVDNELVLPEEAAAKYATAQAMPPASTERGIFDDFARGVGSGAAALPGLVVGAGLEAANLLGGDIQNTSGQDWIRSKLAPLGLTFAPGEEASGMAGAAGEAIGTFAAPVGGVQAALMNRVAPAAGRLTAQGLQQARRAMGNAETTALGRIAEDIGTNAARAPVAFTAAELGGAGGEAAARKLAEDEFGEDSWQAQTAGLVGGMMTGMAPTATGRAASWAFNKAADVGVLPAATTRNLVNNASRRLGERRANKAYTKAKAEAVARYGADSPEAAAVTLQRPPEGAGIRRKAAERVGRLVPNQERFAEAMNDTESVFPEMLTPVQQSNEPGLMRLGARARVDDEQLRSEWAENAEAVMQQARDRVKSLTANEEQAFVSEYGKDMQDMVTAALGKANDTIAKMAPGRDRATAGETIYQELATARAAARQVEREAWNAPELKDVKIPASTVQARYEALKADLPPEMAEDMPTKAFQFLDEASPDSYFKDGAETVPLERLQAFRSALLNESRNAASGANPNRNRARLASQLADGLQEDIMSVAPTNPEAAEAWDTARNISREFNRVFGQGTVGDVLKTRQGAPAMEPAMVAQRTIGRGGTSGRVATEHIGEALGRNNDAVTGAYRDYLRHEFMDTTNPQAFMKRYGEVLDSQPALKREFEDAIAAGDISRVAGDIQDGAASVLGKANPSSEVRRIKQAAKRDETGAVWSSFRKDMLDELLSRSTQKDPTGQLQSDILSGSAMQDLLDGKKTSGAFREAFTKTELADLRRLANTMKRVEADILSNPEAYLTSDSVPIVAELFARLTGANLGERIGQAVGAATGHQSGAGASLQAAGMGSSIMRKLQKSAIGNPTREVILRALGDKQRMRDLLTPANTTPNSRRAMARTQAWVADMLRESPAADELEGVLEDLEAPTLERQAPPPATPVRGLPAPRRGQGQGSVLDYLLP